jgi:epoxyqueuosine reductase
MAGYRPAGWKFLEKEAKKMSFCAVGVAPADKLPERAKEKYSLWLEQKKHGEMQYLEENLRERFNPSSDKIVKNAVVVLSAALPYGYGATQNGFWAYVSGYARGRDYHKTMKKKLLLLGGVIKKYYPKAEFRPFVDSAPVMERSFAELCELGSIGKNGALIVKGIGPKVLLGELIIARVPPLNRTVCKDSALAQLCTQCNICVNSCPTSAIEKDGTIDAGRCLSYYTVEKIKTAMPDEFKVKMSQIFGCDICTEVCPLSNRKILSALEPAVGQKITMSLKELADASCDKIEKAIEGSPLKRATALKIKENACVVLSNKNRDKRHKTDEQ